MLYTFADTKLTGGSASSPPAGFGIVVYTLVFSTGSSPVWSCRHAETPPQDNAYEAESRRGVGVAARPGTPLAWGREVGSAAGRRVNGSTSAVKTHQHQSKVSG